MKIGILTQPLLSNYGGLLQNYALQQILISAGHEVETINWNHPISLKSRLCSFVRQIMAAIVPRKYKKPKYMPSVKESAVLQRNTNRFIESYINHTSTISNYKGICSIANAGQYEAYIVGSDQCWRPRYNSFMPAMFLSFTQDRYVKRIAYAASFGTDNWEFTPEMTSLCAPLAQRFNLVTVREDSGVKLCKDYLGVDAFHVLDPTMLLSKEDYVRLIEAEQEPPSAGTLFNYILDPNETKTAFVNRVAEEMKLIPFQVLPKYQAENRTKNDVKKHIEDCVFPGVTTWLRAFMDAEMTIVDSFHGMVFSILFNKPFWVIGNSNRGMSRFTSLLKVFNLDDRILDVNNLQKTECSKPICWEYVNQILYQTREKSKSLLLDTLE